MLEPTLSAPMAYNEYHDIPYLNALRDIRQRGRLIKNDRTGTGTYSLHGLQMRFDLSGGRFPLLTTKKLFTRGIIEELLWILRGSTDNQELADINVHIWDEWALKEDVTEEIKLENHERAVLLAEKLGITTTQAVDQLNAADSAARAFSGPYATDRDIEACHAWIRARGGTDLRGGYGILADNGIPEYRTVVVTKRGELGPIYGKQWRSWAARDGIVVDQISELIENLTKKPFSRRHVISAWNPTELPDESISPQENVKLGKMALAPCHCLFQFFVYPMTLEERLNYSERTLGQQTSIRSLSVEEQTTALNELGVPDKRLSCQLYQRK